MWELFYWLVALRSTRVGTCMVYFLADETKGKQLIEAQFWFESEVSMMNLRPVLMTSF